MNATAATDIPDNGSPAPVRTCKEIHAAYRVALKALHAELGEAIRAAASKEFPVGTLVRWTMPNHKHETAGVVTGFLIDEPTYIMVRTENGWSHTLHTWELTKL